MSVALSPIESYKLSGAWKLFQEEVDQSQIIIKTPLILSETMAQASGLERVYFKAEYLQAGSSFKIRGALFKLQALLNEASKPMVFTASAGNHGLGLAIAARELGFEAIIHVPITTPQVKIRKIKDVGATLCVAGSDFDDCERVAKKSCSDAGGVYVSSFDDDYVIAGNGGTLAREIEQSLNGSTAPIDLIVPVGGGGMASGIAAYFYESNVRVIGVEPEANCALTESLRLGRYLDQYQGSNSFADGLAGAISEKTFQLCSQGLHTVITVNEEEILRAIFWAHENLGIVIEGSAAVSVAALLGKKYDFSPSALAVLTGANIDPSLLAKARQTYT